MCDNWRSFEFNKYNCQGTAINSGNGDLTITGTVNTKSQNPKVIFWAANPPGHITSYSGSGLPFHNKEQAFENSLNSGIVIALNKQYTFKINYPNSYYVGLGSSYVPPTLHMKIVEEGDEDGNIVTIDLGTGIPYRSLTYPPQPHSRARDSALFYDGVCDLPIINQEQILRNAGYPIKNEMPNNFWGLKPPL